MHAQPPPQHSATLARDALCRGDAAEVSVAARTDARPQARAVLAARSDDAKGHGPRQRPTCPVFTCGVEAGGCHLLSPKLSICSGFCYPIDILTGVSGKIRRFCCLGNNADFVLNPFSCFRGVKQFKSIIGNLLCNKKAAKTAFFWPFA